MKTLSTTLLLLASATVGTSPALATIISPAIKGEPVTFELKRSELSTEAGREAVLRRIKATASAACDGKQSAAYATEKKCHKDLEQQFVTAIGDSTLIAKYSGEAVRVARSD